MSRTLWVKHTSSNLSDLQQRNERYSNYPLQKQFTVCNERMEGSVTRWNKLFFNIWPFTSTKICPMAHKICQSWSKILPKVNKPSINCPTL